MFKQDEKYCYAFALGHLIIFTINNKQKKIECTFCAYLEENILDLYLPLHNEPNCIFPFQGGILFGNNIPFFQYLTKMNNKYDEYVIIEYLVYLNNEKIFDIAESENHLIAIGNRNILVFEINQTKK